MICPCGEKILETATLSPYQQVIYDKDGDIIFALCWHGHIVIDSRPISNGLDDEGNPIIYRFE